MNDQEFIELLNLYVDQEITTEQAARLEAEVLENPKRRKIYGQYCRIQKACVVLSESRRTQDADPEVVIHSAARTWSGLLYAGGLMAAAACVIATVVIRSSHSPAALAVSPVVRQAVVAQAAPALESVANLKPSFLEPGPRLDWISQVRVAPVQRPQAADLVFAAKPDELKPADRPIQIQSSEPDEMTAFQIRE